MESGPDGIPGPSRFPPPPSSEGSHIAARSSSEKKIRDSQRFIAAGAVVLALAAFVFMRHSTFFAAKGPAVQAPISMPESLHGYGRVHSGAFDKDSADATAAGKVHNVQEQVGFFGQGQKTYFYVKAAGRWGFSDTAPDYLRAFATGITKAVPADSIDLDHATEQNFGALDVACATVSGDTPGSACAWTDSITWGFVRTYGDTLDAEALTVEAYNATTGGAVTQ